MIRTIIIDDEPNNITALQLLVNQYCPQINLVGTAADSQSGYDMICRLQPDLVFLDIEMPLGNGFDLLQRLEPVRFEVVFVTAFDKYALTAFRFAALDYLLKPISIRDLTDAVDRVRLRLEEKSSNQRVEALLHNFRLNNGRFSRIGLPSVEGLDFIDVEKLSYLQAEGNCTIVVMKGMKRKLVSRTLKEFEEILPGDLFCRIHHSYIVNLSCIAKYHKGRGGYLELEDGTTLEVSTRRKEEFLLRFKS